MQDNLEGSEMERKGRFHPTVTICILILALARLAIAQYGGGTGEPNAPYLIYTAEQMNAIGADPNDWDKHFKLTADLDLSAYTGNEFKLIGHEMKAFTGVFDGNHHCLRNFTYRTDEANYIGLFARVGFFSGRAEPKTTIRDLGLIDPNIEAGGADYVGALVGHFHNARILRCYVRGGHVSGDKCVGALIGGTVNKLLLSYSSQLKVSDCYAACSVSGKENVGGLVGYYSGICGAQSPSFHHWEIRRCYAAGQVEGHRQTGGLIGFGLSSLDESALRDDCLWDMETSRQATSAGGNGKTTAQMQTTRTFLEAGWDFVGEDENGTEDVWWILEGQDYPRLWWEATDPEF